MTNKKSQATTLKGRKERCCGWNWKGREAGVVAVERDISLLELEPLPVPLHGLSSTTSKVHGCFCKIFTSI